MKISMNRTRWMGAAVAAVALVGGFVAYGVSAGSETAVGPSPTTSAAAPTTTTTAATSTTGVPKTTTTARVAATVVAAPDDGALRRGSRGPAVAELQRRLTALHLDPGAVDGSFGQPTVYAVQAFEKMNGFAPDGRVSTKVQEALASPAPVVPLAPHGGSTRVEVDLRRQLLFVYKDDALRLVTHVSTGSGKKYCVDRDCNNTAITPIGAFRFAWRYSGWRESRLGKLYNPVYFTSSGVAVHGALSVPTYPASHGCVRIPMHIAQYFPSLVKRGDPVYVTDGRDVGPPPPTPTGPPPADPPTTPGNDTPPSTTTSTTTTTTQPTSTTSSTTPTSPTIVP